MSSGLADNQGSDRRRSFRAPHPEPPPAAVLIIGHREIPVSILDESAGGFSILAGQNPRISANDLAQLRFGAAVYRVRVVFIGRAPRTPDGGKSPGCRLGLERIGEAQVQDIPIPRVAWWNRLGVPAHDQPERSMMGSIAMIGLLLIAAPLLVAMLLTATHQPMGQWLGPGDRSSPHDAEEPSLAESTSRQVRVMIEQMPGAAALMAPSVTEQLTLNESQRSQIQLLVDKTNTALEQFEEFTRDDTRKQRARKRTLLFEESRRLALEVLTPAQRAEWEAIVAASSR